MVPVSALKHDVVCVSLRRTKSLVTQCLVPPNWMDSKLRLMQHCLHVRPFHESHRVRPSVHPFVSIRVVHLLHLFTRPRVLASTRRLDERPRWMPWHLLLTSRGCELVVLGCHDERK